MNLDATYHSRSGPVAKEEDAIEALFDQINIQYSDAYEHNPAHLSAVSKLISLLPQGARVLDIGCATGRPTARMLADAGMDLIGIDISQRMVSAARQNVPEGTFHHINVAEFRAKEGSFDAVVAILAILTLPTASATAMAFRIASWLRPSGGILLLGQLDLNDFPQAEGRPTDLRGEWVEHPFMDTFVRDNVMSVGEWIGNLRQAGVVLNSADGTTFDIRPGSFVPEPECFVFGTRGVKDPLLGPYKHPYLHQPSPKPGPGSWEALLRRWVTPHVGDDRGIINSAASDGQLVIGRLDGAPKPSAEVPHSPHSSIELTWALDVLTDPASAIDATIALIRAEPYSHSPPARMTLFQASPTNDALYILNRVLSFLTWPRLHHGALLQQAVTRLEARGFQVVAVELVPGYLDFSDVTDADRRVEAIARLLKDVWFDDVGDPEFVEKLLTLEVGRYVISQRELTGDEGRVGFDSVRLSAVARSP